MEEVLIIDDSRQIAELLAEQILPFYGYRARVVPTGWEGLSFIKQRQPDLILLDLQLPDTSGLDILRQLGELGYDIPVILMTAHGTEQTAVEAFRLGARNYLIKPFDAVEAGNAIERALRERRLQREKDILTRTLQQRLQELTILSSIGKSVTGLLDLEELLERIVEAGVYLTHAEECFLLLRDGQELYLRAAKNLGDERVQRFRVRMEDTIAGQVIETVKPIRINKDERGPDLKIKTGFLVHSLLQVPLTLGKQAIGVLGVANRQSSKVFSENDQYLLSAVADYAAIAIENSRLFQSMKDSEGRYRGLFDNASDIIFTLDPQLNLTSLNRQGIKLLGHEQPLIGHNLLTLCDPESREEIGQQLNRRLNKTGGDGTPFPLPLRRANGEPLYTEVNAQLWQRNGVLVGLHCIARDITERRRLEMQLLQAEKLSAIGQLVAGVAHELNNPLTSVKGFTELLLRRKDLDQEARSDLDHIHAQSERAARIVTNLLTFAREHQPQRVPVDLNQVVEDTLSLHAYHLRVDNIKIQRKLDPHIPPVIADPYQLQQVFLNLIGNAHQAMADRGGGTLTVESETRNGEVTINLGDTGPGIPQHLVGRIFDPFFTTKPVGKGTGLGLSICFNIVQDHSGTIWVDSVSNEGTTFHLAFPIASDDELLSQGVEPVKRYTPAIHADHHLLVVDDEEGVCEFVRRLLADLGHRVTVANTGEQALQAISQYTFDLILTDVKMPGMNGFQLYRAIQERNPALARRVVFVTGDTMSPSTQAALRQMGNHVISKPFSSEKLESKINELLAAGKDVEQETLR